MATSELWQRLFKVRSYFVVAMALSCVMAGGCRRSSFETVPVQGTVSYQGRPAPYGMVSFQPIDANRGRSAVASIKADGTYVVETLKDSSGLVAGEYRVVVSLIKPPGLDEKSPGVSSATGKPSDGLPTQPLSSPNLIINAGDGTKVFDISLEGK